MKQMDEVINGEDPNSSDSDQLIFDTF